MKFAVSLAVLALAVAVFAVDSPAPPSPAFTCTGKDQTGKLTYKDPLSGKGWTGNYACMKYHDCKGGKDNPHACFWLIPLRQYNPTTRKCTWFWSAKCTEDDPK